MKADFTRRTFSQGKHYSGVRMQQGRVQLDADWNELVDIQAHLHRTQGADVFGQSGAPKPQQGAHFQLGVTESGADLTLAPGRFYVDGILCELEQGSSYLGQPDLPTPPFVTGEGGARALALETGTYLAYLDVWEQLVTALEDPGIREVALGGPDTTVRTRTLWQVKLAKVSGDPAATGWTPSLPAPGTGTLMARAQPSASGGEPLLVPAGAGYRRLENQLYRVEVHAVSESGRVTAKWSRDNGAVVAPWLSGSGDSVTIGGSGRNELLGFTSAAFVELTDDARELQGQGGLLYGVKAVNGAILTLDTTAAGSPGTFDRAAFPRNPKARRWEGRLEWESGSGAPDWLALEDGVEVKPSAGTFRVGDYWLIPARHLTADVEWPRDGVGSPLPRLPHGVAHHYAPLAVVRKPAVGNPSVEDRRKVFPALTALTAKDVGFDSTVFGSAEVETVQEALDHLYRVRREWAVILLPGDDVVEAFAQIPPGTGVRVHFGPGTFTLTQAIHLTERGDIQISGSGPATRIIRTGGESVFSFLRCGSVLVRDLHAEAGSVEHKQGLRGPIAFEDCPSVTVENVSVKCGADWRRGTACISVRNTPSDTPAPVPTTARIRSCDLKVGHQQVGILLLDVERSQVEDNVITTYAKPAALDAGSLVDTPEYRGLVRRLLMTRLRLLMDPLAEPDAVVSGGMFGSYHVYFDADPSLRLAWQDLLRVVAPTVPESEAGKPWKLAARLQMLAEDILLTRGVPGIPNLLSTTITTFRNWFERLRAASPAVASQGITVAGARATEVRIRDNTLRDVLQGIHMGVSQRASSRAVGGTLRRAGRVHITGNEVHVLMTAESLGERHGIFVGNCDTLLLEDNHVRVARKTFLSQLGIDAIRVYGSFGRLLTVQRNHVVNPAVEPDNVGLRVKALNSGDFPTSLWRITDNVSVCQTPELIDLAPPTLG
ncbi:DUF6519 domain-containing protein [Myxococcus sp. RHSTA-1-4]|uniref:DUF6519 domain-containing protein n=1 Tax=Myxococcus sp. RHSTA-1-4 TaxID=2874601 RepID=UPI001CBE1DC2|nr:DUF6519 domain-containing protein [Myxococcus sp. RHSTA-1-4]MBZ4415600.1 DUF6519 domain-containing protein [Myxococcus sp. RHSTA-1-4]